MTAPAAPTQLPPAVVVPISVTVRCPACQRVHRWPSAAVGLIMRCRCGQRVHVDLRGPAEGPRCRWCGGPMPAGTDRATYCTTGCRTAAREERRRDRAAAARAS